MFEFFFQRLIHPILRRIDALEESMSVRTDAIKAAVSKNRDAFQSLKIVIAKLVVLVAENREDPEALDAILAEVNADTDDIVAEALKNTPADPNAPTP